uniref:Uncharacterized protein n=1 Tax=Anguilla anguilla TaxID=7936 RepID=A0A0E9UN39_ANGAN
MQEISLGDQFRRSVQNSA